MKKIMAIAWLLIGLLLFLPIMNLIFDAWIQSGGIFETTFNTSVYGNATSNNTSIELTETEWAIWRLWVPITALFLIGTIFYIVGNWSRNKGEQ